MLLRFFKIFLGIVFTFIAFFLVFFTFFINEDSSNTNYSELLSNNEEGIFNISFSGTTIIESKEATNSGVFIQKLNSLDSIYFTEINSVSVLEDTNDLLKIKLDKGIYILDLNDLTKTYTVSANGFNIEPIGGGKIYVDTLSDQNLVFSINSTFNLEFIDTEKQEIITSIYLFPHNYIKFYPEKNLGLANTDLYRIKTKISNGYFGYKLTNTLKINILLHEKGAGFFNIVSKHFIKNDLLNTDKYNIIDSLEFYSYPGKEYIDKYFSIFINKSKKKFYYKNIVYNDVIELFDLDIKNDSKINTILLNIDKLKELSINDYNEVVSLIKGIYSVVAKYNDIEDSEKLYNFINLINKIDKKEKAVDVLNKKFNYLKNIYLYYDFKGDKLNTYFKIFIEKFFSELEENNNKIVFTSAVSKRFMESFLFYFEDYIEDNLYIYTDESEKELYNKDKLADYNFILHKYLLLNNTIYFSDTKVYEVVKTGLLRNKDILLLISDYILNSLLEEIEKSENTIFIVKKRVSQIEQKDIENLKADISFILKLYKNNITILDDKKDKLLLSVYSTFESKFHEYFLALLDYTQYSLEFDVSEKGLIDHIKNNQGVTEKNYTEQDVRTYLSSFNSVNIGNIIINETEVKNTFSVENFNVNNNILSFNIDFSNFKTIKDIYINGQITYNTYLLDDLEISMKELYDIVPLEEKEKYNFKNFFYQIVSKTSESQNTDIYIYKQDELEESKAISTFKRNILSNDGELGKINSVLSIKYNNLQVNSVDNIIIKDSILYTKVDVSRNIKSYISHLSSKYFLDKDGSYLYDSQGIQLTVYTENGYSKDSPMFGGNKLKIIGKIKISELKTTFENIAYSFDKIDNIYSTILNLSNASNLSINYILETNNIIVKLENNGKIINITLLGDNVISIMSGGTEYIKSPVRYNLISDILKQIK
ncbi:MAG: hypothetical protein PHH06_00165 [Candidatus Gracilibacteria bacterium]|nr:hypothetical protein [Candidatus Gracilibacteria bacterium]